MWSRTGCAPARGGGFRAGAAPFTPSESFPRCAGRAKMGSLALRRTLARVMKGEPVVRRAQPIVEGDRVMQTPKASPTFRRSRWPALVFAIVASAAMPRGHATDAELAPDGAGITLQVLLSVDPLDPPGGYDHCGIDVALEAYTGENVRWCYRITNNSDAPLTRHSLQSSEFGTILDRKSVV